MIYLYLKTHNETGLKYFGKFSPNTTYQDVHKYPGSGKYWRRHLRKNGYNYTTEVVAIFEDMDEAEAFALSYSEQNDIAESEEFANLKPENARNGGHGGRPDLIYTEEIRKKMSAAKYRTIAEKGTAFLTRPHTEETKKRMSDRKKELAKNGFKPCNAGKIGGWNKGLKTGPQKRIECSHCGEFIANTWIKRHEGKCDGRR